MLKANHNGEKRNLKFDLKKFSKFKKKIIYLVYNEIPKEVENIDENDTENEKSTKYILNAIHRENGQRNYITEGLKNANDEDLILISDVDEIPNLKEVDLKKKRKN